MRDIRELGCSPEFNAANFGDIAYVDSRGRQQKAYVMTRDGFTLLVMGYTGELAMKFKEAYIRQFNAMEAALMGKKVEREKGIAVRQALTKALQQSTENTDSLRDCFTQEEVQAVQSMDCLVSGLVYCGWEYIQVKEFILKNNALRQLAA